MRPSSTAAPGWFDYAAIALAALAFTFAWVQLSKTKTAAEESSNALNLARIKLNGDQLAASLPQLKSIASDLDLSLKQMNVDLGQRVLIRFSEVGKETVSILNNISGEHVDLSTKINTLSGRSLDLKGFISIKGMSVRAISQIKAMQVEIDKIAGEILEVVSKNRYQLKEK